MPVCAIAEWDSNAPLEMFDSQIVFLLMKYMSEKV